MTATEARELIPLQVLGALDAPTARQIEEYLQTASVEEQREAAEFREVVALLPLALLAPAVPDKLKENLLSRLSQGTVSSNSAAGAAGQVLDFKRPVTRQPQFLQMTPWLAMAAAVLLASLSIFLYQQNTQLRNERTALAQELQQAQSEIAQMQAPATRVIAMQGKEAPQASAKVFWDTARHQWVVAIFDLPAPPTGMEYQLWYVTKEAKLSAAVFRPSAGGRSELRLALPAGVPESLAATAVTLEPRGGSPQPTGKFYLMAQL